MMMADNTTPNVTIHEQSAAPDDGSDMLTAPLVAIVVDDIWIA
jgi:hypothetical protein